MFVIGCVRLVVCRLLFTFCWYGVLFVAIHCFVLVSVLSMLLVVVVTCCLLCVVCWVLGVACCVLFVDCSL